MAPTPDKRPAEGLRLAAFGLDRDEASQIRRIKGLQPLGCQVTGFYQRRGAMAADRATDWDNIDPGLTPNHRLFGRGLGLFAAMGRALRGWQQLSQADLILVRNLELALIALVARGVAGWRRMVGQLAGGRLKGRFSGKKVRRQPGPQVYEVLDIHGPLTREGPLGAVMRWAERRVLARSALVVVPSPGFLRQYFGPVRAMTARSRWWKINCGWDRMPRPDPLWLKGCSTARW